MKGLMKMQSKLTVAAIFLFGLLGMPFQYLAAKPAPHAPKAAPTATQTQAVEEDVTVPADRSIVWKPGATLGVKANGEGIGVLSGTGRLDYDVSGAHVTGNVTADGRGGFVFSDITSGTTTSEYYDGARVWKAGAILGIRGKGIGVLSGSGKLDYEMTGAHVTGNVTADGKGRFIYSNVVNGTTTSEYWDGARMWKVGTILGIGSKGIGVLSGTGKLNYEVSGAHVTGDVRADGKGNLIYSNVVNGTTTSEYWDGAKLWKAGAVLGIKGKNIGVVKGAQESH